MHPAKFLKKNGASNLTSFLAQDGQQKERLKIKKRSRMSFTHDQLKSLGYKLNADGSYSRTETCSPRVSDPKPQPIVRKELLDSSKPQKAGRTRLALRITRYATRLLDEDNLSGAKLLVDQMRYAGILPDDDPGSTKIILDQIKVSKKTEERTEISIKQL